MGLGSRHGRQVEAGSVLTLGMSPRERPGAPDNKPMHAPTGMSEDHPAQLMTELSLSS